MKALAVAGKSLREMVREPSLLLLTLFFPPVLVVLYYLSFGQGEKGMAEYLRVLVRNEDLGAPGPDGRAVRAGDDLVAALRAQEFDGKPVFTVVPVVDPAAAAIELAEHKAAALVVIPAGYTRGLDPAAPAGTRAPVELHGDPASFHFVFARTYLAGMTRAFAAAAAGAPPPPSASFEFLPGTGTLSDFEYGVPGTVVFGILFLVITAATVLVRESVQGTLTRLQLSRAGAADLLLGVTLAQVVLALAQMPITFGTALLCGFRSPGSLGLAALAGVLVAVAAVGMGLLTACFARNDGEAASLGSGVMVPMAFLSGTVFPMPAAALFTLGGREFRLWDLLPTTHAAEALRRVLVFGDGLGDVAFELLALTLLSALFLAAGIAAYGRRRLRAR